MEGAVLQGLYRNSTLEHLVMMTINVLSIRNLISSIRIHTALQT